MFHGCSFHRNVYLISTTALAARIEQVQAYSLDFFKEDCIDLIYRKGRNKKNKVKRCLLSTRAHPVSAARGLSPPQPTPHRRLADLSSLHT